MSEMFSRSPLSESQKKSGKVSSKNNKRKRKKKSSRKNGVGKNKRKNDQIPTVMSAWAENFTFAATWQLKHQLAYWKARAKALEYENGVLHDIIRKKNYVGPPDSDVPVDTEVSTQVESDSEFDEDCVEELDEEGELVLSDEFLQFLKDNAKFREDARRERERLKAKNSEDNLIEEMEAGPSENTENKVEILKKLYGDKWQRISALEMSLECNFINETDKDKPMYWPNIPFNFNFG